jgi:polyisoprenoid-binding protein YceI
VAVSLALSAPVQAAETFALDKSHSEVTFRVRHLGVSNVSGRFNDFEGSFEIDREKPEASKVEFTIKSASIDTANEGRDKHLRSADFFDVEKYPAISFRSSKVVPAGEDKFNVTGSFTMRDVTREVTLPVTVVGWGKGTRGEERVGFEVVTQINRKDYNVSYNRVLDTGGVVVSDEVNVTITLAAYKRPAPAPSAPAAN